MGKKLLCLIMAICCVLSFTACNSGNIAMDSSAKTETAISGGFVAETADYVYFINGIENYATAYKNGEVTKASLMRTKKANLTNLSEATYETVVSKLIVSSDNTAGIYIYGDYVYYAVPSVEKDKTGVVKNDQLSFFRTKLNGSGTSKNIPGTDFPHSAKFRYIQSGNNVYLVVYNTDLYVYDANTCKEVYTTAGEDSKITVSEVMFSQNNNDANVYFTTIPVNEELSDDKTEQKYTHHEVYQVALSATESKATAKVVLDGIGNKVIGNDGADAEGVDTLGVTIDLLRYVDGTLYFSYTSLTTTIASANYMAIPDTAYTAEWNNRNWIVAGKDYKISGTNKNSASIFADTSIIVDSETIIYVDATYGLLVYNYKNVADAENSDLGVSPIYTSDTIKGATLAFVNKEGEENILYFYDSSNNYYRVSLTKILNGEEVEEFRINKLALNTTWYKPEVVKVGEDYCFIAIYSDIEYDSYCYVINMTALEKEYNEITDEEEKENFYTVEEMENEEFAEFISNNLLGQRSEADIKADEEK